MASHVDVGVKWTSTRNKTVGFQQIAFVVFVAITLYVLSLDLRWQLFMYVHVYVVLSMVSSGNHTYYDQEKVINITNITAVQ